MKIEEFDQIVSELEEKATLDPNAYKWHVAQLAILGYAYIFGLVLFMLGIVALLLYLMLIVKALILIKFSFLFLIAAWLVVKSLWVTYPEPEGMKLSSDQVPALFELIDEIQKASKGPPIHTVLLTEEFNCAISQVPRLGIFGWHKNFLILGLPLMQSVSQSQFKSILAHEMGHLSDQHGKFSSWVYHVRHAWHQTYMNLAYESSFGVGLVKRFADWFVPLFEAHTLVLMREHEFAADRISATVAGAESATHALIQTSLKGSFLNDEYWKSYWNKVYTEATPPSNAFLNLRSCLKSSLDSNRAENILRSQWAKHDTADTHPSLSERVHALLPEKDWSDPKHIADEAAQRFYVDKTAAEELFGAAITPLEDELEQRFCKQIGEKWAEGNKAATENRERIDKLEKEAETRALTEAEAQEVSSLYSLFFEPEIGIEKCRKFLQQFPESAILHFTLGMMLIEQKSDEGIAELEASVKLKAVFGPDVYSTIRSYLLSKGKEDEAKAYYKKMLDSSAAIDAAAAQWNCVSNEDHYEPHKLSQDHVDDLSLAINMLLKIKEAFVLAKKIVPDTIGGHQHILVLKLQPFTSDEEGEIILNQLVQLPQLDEFYLLLWGIAPKTLAKACTELPSVKIFDRSTWIVPKEAAERLEKNADDPINVLAASHQQSPGFLAKHKWNIIAVFVILAFLIVFFFTFAG